MTEHEEMNRLERALEAWLRFVAGEEGESEKEFLSRHEDLRDLLETLLRGEQPDQPDADEHVFGDFHLRRQIGRGGMGVVYEAWQASLDRRVAVKVLPEEVNHNPKSVARFKKEASTAARLDCPGIVDVFAVGVENGRHYFAMEFIEGAPLDKIIAESSRVGLADADGHTIRAAVSATRHRSMDEVATAPESDTDSGTSDTDSETWTWDRDYVRTVVGIAAQVADALDYAHKRGVIHRDVKPSNVLLRPNGRAILTDFGLAREQGLPSLTATGEFAGTPYYVSPEQAQGRQAEIDQRSDVFSLAVTLYELLTHRRPFEGSTTQSVLEQIIHREPLRPHKLNPLVGPDLVAVVTKAMEKDPRRRYDSAADFAADLRNVLAHLPVTARRLTGLHRVRRWMRREPLKAVLAAVLIIGVPTISWLAGYLLSQQKSIEVGEETILRDQLDRTIEAGFLCLGRGQTRRAAAHFRAAMDLDPESIAAVGGLAAALFADEESAEVRTLLAARPDLVDGSAGLRRFLRIANGGDPTAPSPEDEKPETSLDFLLAGLEEMLTPVGTKSRVNRSRAAYRLFGRATDRSERARPVHYYLRILAANNGELKDECVDLVRCVEQFWPDAPNSWEWLAIGLTQAAPERAIRYYEKAIEHNPKDAFLRAALARIMLMQGDIHRAEARFREAIALDPGKPLLRLTLAMLKFQTKDLAGAEAECDACRDLPLDVDDYHAVGSVYLRLGKSDKAIELLKKGLDKFPDSIVLHHAMGGTWLALGRRDKALDFLKRACDLDPDDPNSWHKYASSLGRAGRGEAAIDAWREYVRCAPDDEQAEYHLARALFRAGRFEECRTVARRATSRDAKHAPSHDLLGRCLAELGEFDAARPHFARALELHAGKYRAAYDELAAKWAGELPRLAGAVLLRQLTVDQSPADPKAHAELVSTLRRAGEFNRLRRELHRWIAIDEESASAWHGLARHLLDPTLPNQWRAPDTAVWAAKRAVELNGRKDATLLAALADAHYAKGDRESARVVAREALAAMPADADGKEQTGLRDRLRELENAKRVP